MAERWERRTSPAAASCFFSLFGDFRHYLEVFLLEDLVDPHCLEIRWYLPFDAFNRSPHPQTADVYGTYRQASLRSVRSRNRRILTSGRP